MKAAVKKVDSVHFDDQMTERYFKLINIGEKLMINCEYIDEKYIEFKSSSLFLSSLKLVDTTVGTSYEGQKLSGKKLILCGYIDTRFFIEKEGCCLYIKKNIPLSTFVVVPKYIKKCDVNNIRYCLEDVTIVNIECNYVFISVTLYIEYIVDSETA